MAQNTHTKITIFTLTLSIVAILLSTFSLSKAGKVTLDDKEFMAKIEKGIKEFVVREKAAKASNEEPSEAISISVDDDAMLGDKNAPVTIIEFSDFECTYCVRFVQDTLPEIISKYIDTGKARLVYRDFPFDFHANAKNAAMAAECLREQGGDSMYFQYHDKLYENNTDLSIVNLKKWAGEFGLNTSKFNACLDGKKYSNEVNNDFIDGKTYGVTGTPVFFINGRKLSGAYPFSVFKTIIDEELRR